MKHLNTFITAILLSTFVFVVLKIVIIPYENQTIYKQEELVINPWENIDTKNLIGQPVDTCQCVLINGALYKANVYQKTTFTYTPIKP